MPSKLTIEYWGEAEPSLQMVADDAERIARMIREGFTGGEAGMDEDFDGSGGWSLEGDFSDDDDE